MSVSLINLTEFLITVARLYFVAGLIFTIPFLLFGLHKLDHGAQWQTGFMNMINGILFRVLITPGMCTFWPLFVVRLIRCKTVPTETNAHRKLAKQN